MTTDAVHRAFNDYLQTNLIRTADTDINTAIYEALGDLGYVGSIDERLRAAASAEALDPQNSFQIALNLIPSLASAFPTLESSASGIEDTAVTSHTVTMPAGVTVGDVLLVFFRTANTVAHTHSAPVGWNLVGVEQYTEGRLSVYTKVADGTEGASITMTTSATRRSAWVTHRISGAHGDVSGTFVGSALSSDPPDHTPAWGSAKNLWFAVASGNASDWAFTVQPTDFINLIEIGSTASALATRCRIASSNQNLEAVNLNPGVYTSTGGSAFVSATIAVRPV